jgi:DNA recombination protein RmuC
MRWRPPAGSTYTPTAKSEGELDSMAQQLHGLTHTTASSLDAMRQQNGTSLLAHLTQAQTDAATGRKELSQALHSLRAELSGTLGVMSGTLNERLAAIQSDNSAKLEEMRRTVDEKLHATLEQRLGESFKLLSERLEQVQHGLGEMKSLAAIIENVLTIDQYGKNG